MSVQVVREYLKPFHLDERIREFSVSSATVELALWLSGWKKRALPKPFPFFPQMEKDVF